MPCSEPHSSAEESLTTLCSQGGAQPPRSGNSPAPQGHKKTLYVKTYGCQMNVYDSTRMQDVMALEGYAPIATAEGADVVILNTCHIREKAEEKVYSDLGRLRALKHAAGGKMLIAVGGCVGQAEGEEIFRRAPYVDMVFGPQSYHLLPEMVAKAARGENRTMALDFAPEPKFDALPVPAHNAVSAFLSVQEGCDKFCTFCVVPYTRGAEYSRPVSAILREAEALVGAGAQEITLLGQNVNAWHGQGEGGEWGLGRLLRALAGIPGLARLRYTTSHPRDMDDDLIHAHGELETLMPFLHLPVQSGSDRILARMNRKHTTSEYLTIIEKLRSRRSDMAFSSDIIVGFPGETELDFAATLRLVETVGFAQCYSFAYSPRPGTPAASDAAQLPGAVKDERLRTLQALIMRQQLAFNQSVVGRTLPVLFDRLGKRPGQWLGKTPYMQSVYLDAPEKALPRRILPITVREAYQNSVTGVLADSLPVPRRNLAS